MKKLVLLGLVTAAALVPASPAAAAPDTLKCIVLYDGSPEGYVGCVV